jgi:streptogramin lyase
MFPVLTRLAGIRGSQDRRAVAEAHRRRASHHFPDRHRARFRLEGLEERCLLSITEFPLSHNFARPYLIAAGQDGNLWFTDEGASKIGMINPATCAVTDFTLPSAPNQSEGIAAGPDGNLWFTEYGYNSVHDNQIGMINPATHAITEFDQGPAITDLWQMAAGPDGNLWFTEDRTRRIGMINPATHAISEFAVPSGGTPGGVTAGPDGNLWFTEGGTADEIGMFNPTTHAISEFAVPSGGSPGWITAGPDGNLWFTESFGTTSKIGMFNPTTHAISEFAVPTAGADPAVITAGPDGNLWFTESNSSVHQIGRINPVTGAITEFLIPYTNSQPVGITAGPDGNLWYTDMGVSGAPAIGVITLAPDSAHLVVTQQPPASVTAGSGFGLTVQARDGSGNLVTYFNGPVSVMLASNPGGATVGGTVTVTASSGVATFPGVTLDKAASGYTLIVSGIGATYTTTSAVTVTPAAATQLAITQQPPATVQVNKPFALKASVEDAYGNVVTTASNSVSVAFASNPTGATLGGTLTVTASQGVASFTNLTINKVGTGYTLRVSGSGLTSATSNAINVTKSGKAPSALLASAGSTATDLSLAPLVFDSSDLWYGLRFKKRSWSIR